MVAVRGGGRGWILVGGGAAGARSEGVSVLMKRKIAVGALAGAAIAAGALFASPASADTVQNGCQGTSFKLFSSTTGYCFNMVNGVGSPDYFKGIWALSYQSDAYGGQIQLFGLSGWYWQGFGYQQTGSFNNGNGALTDAVWLTFVD